MTVSSYMELTVRKEVKNYKSSTQELKKLRSLQPLKTETHNPTGYPRIHHYRIIQENGFTIREKSMHAMQSLGLDPENSQHEQSKAQLEEET